LSLFVPLDGIGREHQLAQLDDEDALELDPGSGTWELAYDASAAQVAWAGADLDALYAA
jgi:hypothetical protein